MTQPTLLELLRYKRFEGSVTQAAFCQTFLEPVFGDPDVSGNYIHIIPDKDGLNPRVCFAAHHDTVHKTEGFQEVKVAHGFAYSGSNECLGADCTTGVWLILEMIAAQIPGVYVIHAAEEVGCKGSSVLVASDPDWLSDLKAVISFDRYGTDSIITHQMGFRTASEAFSDSLEGILGLGLRSDPTGSYTDSNEYADVVSECTNISVGYYNQHTAKESQDLEYAEELRDALLKADWSKLVFARNPRVIERDDYSWMRNWGKSYDYYSGKEERNDLEEMEQLIRDYPDVIADMLQDWGFNKHNLLESMEEFAYDDAEFINQKVSYR